MAYTHCFEAMYDTLSTREPRHECTISQLTMGRLHSCATRPGKKPQIFLPPLAQLPADIFAVGASTATAPGHEFFFFHFTFSIDPLLWRRLLVVAMRAPHAPHTHGWRGATPGCTCRPWKVVCAWSSTIFSCHFVFWILIDR